MPDMSTVVQAASDVPSSAGHQHRCGEPSTKKRRRGAAWQWTVRRQKLPSIEDTCTVDRTPPGPLGELLPAGTCLRRPPGFLVQHIANVIHKSPRQMLRVQHIYEALRNKFPFFRFVDKDAHATFKSSVRHALFQRWFIKVPSSNATNSFWSLNYSERPHDWIMPKKEEQGRPNETTEALNFASDLGPVPSPARTPPDLEPPRDIRMSSVPTTGASQLPMVSSQSQEKTSTSSSPLPVLLSRTTQATPKSSPSDSNPLSPTPQYRDTGVSSSAPARAEPTPVGMCTGLKETPTVDCPGPLPVQVEEETDALSNAYVSSIMPDMSTIVQAASDVPSCAGRQHLCDEPSTKRRRGAGLQSTFRRQNQPNTEDTCTVDRAPPGPLGELLPAGTCLRRPSGFLVEHIANAIHKSPRQMLRASHIYEALRNKFPFYRFVDMDAQATWMSSVRHALCQCWFIKVPSSKARNSFWSLNYSERYAYVSLPRAV
ncbi:uncharacterized protein LOC144120286 [Amblyomma americanum]